MRVTANHIVELLHPYMANAYVKERLLAALYDMGIPALPMVPVKRYAEVYERFQKVINDAIGVDEA